MRRLMMALAILASLVLGSNAAAQESAYFGVRLGFPFLIGVQGGANFGSFGVRGVAEGTFLASTTSSAGLFNLAVDGFYRVPINEDDSSVYVGGGVGLLGLGGFVSGNSGAFASGFAARLILGFEFMLGPSFGLYTEIAPLWLVVAGGGAQLLPLPVVSVGGNFRL